MTLPRIDIEYGDSIPILAYWDDDYTGTPVRITLVGTAGVPLNNAAKQLCYFTLVDQSTVSQSNPNGTPVTVGVTTYHNIPLLLDTTPTQCAYTVQDLVPVGRYSVVAIYDSVNTTDSTITPFRKKALGEVIISRSSKGDSNPQ